MTNATMRKFGHPQTLVAETAHWSVLVRPQQVTLGSLVLACREPVRAFGEVSPGAFAELQPVVSALEALLSGFVAYERINYLMLMMVDPDVHFHVIPRYQGTRSFEGTAFPDAGWPAQPALGSAVEPAPEMLDRIVAALRGRWAGPGAQAQA
ncbi:HIT family protein [Arenibaculum pallidiluteum]|uniref:HIT family protein n=1 Tax=Arenibaculum pallidiluteum TaxID=2812559 RepID=UPI001F3353C6|nr:HIT family protein [Arenibaculum pallidiluteum]